MLIKVFIGYALNYYSYYAFSLTYPSLEHCKKKMEFSLLHYWLQNFFLRKLLSENDWKNFRKQKWLKVMFVLFFHFFLPVGDFWICLHPECKNLRAMSFQVTGLWSLHVCTLNSSLIVWMLVEDSLLLPKKLLPTHLILKRRSFWRLWLSLLVITMLKR